VFSLTAPTEDEVRRFITQQKDSGFSYPDVGASATVVPAGYNVDHNRVQLGKGEDIKEGPFSASLMPLTC
jgi:uncharacterized protein (UPF0548 family)